jgi:hypothetical protein
MMSIRRDPLLGGARAFLTFLLGLLIVAMIGLAAGIPALLIYGNRFLAELSEQYGSLAGRSDVIWGFISLVATGLILAALAFRFLLHLRRIVDSVATGDPFAPRNADRLTAMAWITLAGQVVVIPAIFIGAWLATILKDADFEFEISLSAILLALVLFILARVFRHGAAMREDLEGTV